MKESFLLLPALFALLIALAVDHLGTAGVAAAVGLAAMSAVLALAPVPGRAHRGQTPFVCEDAACAHERRDQRGRRELGQDEAGAARS